VSFGKNSVMAGDPKEDHVWGSRRDRMQRKGDGMTSVEKVLKGGSPIRIDWQKTNHRSSSGLEGITNNTTRTPEERRGGNLQLEAKKEEDKHPTLMCNLRLRIHGEQLKEKRWIREQ